MAWCKRTYFLHLPNLNTIFLPCNHLCLLCSLNDSSWGFQKLTTMKLAEKERKTHTHLFLSLWLWINHYIYKRRCLLVRHTCFQSILQFFWCFSKVTFTSKGRHNFLIVCTWQERNRRYTVTEWKTWLMAWENCQAHQFNYFSTNFKVQDYYCAGLMNSGLEELWFLYHLSYVYRVPYSFLSCGDIPELSFSVVLFVQRSQLRSRSPV